MIRADVNALLVWQPGMIVDYKPAAQVSPCSDFRRGQRKVMAETELGKL